MEHVRIEGLGLLCLIGLQLSIGCSGQDSSAELSSAEPRQAPAPLEETQPYILNASQGTRANLGVSRYEFHQGADGRYTSYAMDDANAVLGIVEVQGLSRGAGSPTADPGRMGSVKFDVVYPGPGTLIEDIHSERVTTRDLEAGSFSAQLLEALRVDVADVRSKSPAPPSESELGQLESAQSSDLPPDEGGVIPIFLSSPQCFTEAKCFVAVLVCTNRCCDAVDAVTLKPIQCVTHREACGLCFGPFF